MKPCNRRGFSVAIRKRLYFSMLDPSYTRPGGTWWCKDFESEEELRDHVEIFFPVVHSLGISDVLPLHTPMTIRPPPSTRWLKGTPR